MGILRSHVTYFLFLFVFLLSPDSQAREWTVLHFSNGKNSLDDEIAHDVNEMELSGSSPDVQVLSEWGSTTTGKTVRLEIQKDNDPEKITSPVKQDLGKVDMGDWRSVVDFVKWGVSNYPAKRYMLVIGDHGSGWHGLSKDDAGVLSIDEETNHSINVHQIGLMTAAIAKGIGRKIDIVGFDACLMAMAEVAGEMWGSAEILIGSQETEPGPGWDYTPIIQNLLNRPKANPPEVSAMIVKGFERQYAKGEAKITLSALYLKPIEDLAFLMKALSQQIESFSQTNPTAFEKAIQNALAFDSNDYADLIDFARMINKEVPLQKEWKKKFGEVMGQILIAHVSNFPDNRAKGLSIWLPKEINTFKTFAQPYSNLRFNRGTNWIQTLAKVYH